MADRTCADLFAGAGGLSVGFHQAGYRTLFFNEISADAAATYRANFPSAVPFVQPIQELSAADILARCPDAASIDVLCGGPPCQGFSINAPIRSEDDPRNHLFRHYARLVLEGLRPKFIVLENVPGLVSLDGGKTLRDVAAAFERAGYSIAYRILNAAHYGVPQERWRLVLLGTRLTGITPSLPDPTHYSTRVPNFTGGSRYTFAHAVRKGGASRLPADGLLPPVTIGQAIGDLPPIPSGGGADEMEYGPAATSAYQTRMRDAARLLNHECANLARVNQQRITHVKPGGSWRDIPHDMLPKGMQRAKRSDHTRRYGRLHPDEVSGTILTKCDPHWGTVVHYAQDRVLSVREAARLQSFPDSFRFTGAKVQMYRQVGNAVPPLLAQAIAAHIAALLDAASRPSANVC